MLLIVLAALLVAWAAILAAVVGLCVNGQVLGIPPSDPCWDPLYQLAIEAGRPIMILTGLTGIGQGFPGGKGIVLDHAHPRHIDAVAARFNEAFTYRWERVIEFLKLHYVLSKRSDSPFWIEHREAHTVPARLRELLGPEIPIEVDGGIDASTAEATRATGATLFVAGSSIFGSGDPAAAYTEIATAVGAV